MYLTPEDYDAYGERLPLIHVSNLGDTRSPRGSGRPGAPPPTASPV
ncbi:hypothetical protein ACR6C2_29850 [Streptomyces sp. INA 01156]